jgi:hypothetical protein
LEYGFYFQGSNPWRGNHNQPKWKLPYRGIMEEYEHCKKVRELLESLNQAQERSRIRERAIFITELEKIQAYGVVNSSKIDIKA